MAEGFCLVLLGTPASRDNFGLVKRGLEHPLLVAMISQLTRTRPALAGPGLIFRWGTSMVSDKRAIRGLYVNPGEEAERTPQGHGAPGLGCRVCENGRTDGPPTASSLVAHRPQSRVRVAVSWQQQSPQIESLSSRDHRN